MPTGAQIKRKYEVWKQKYQMNKEQKDLFDVIVSFAEEFDQFKRTSKSYDMLSKMAWQQNIDISVVYFIHNFVDLVKSLENTENQDSDCNYDFQI